MIKHVRGDTEQIKIEFVRDGQSYTPTDVEDGDIFTLTIREMFGAERVVLQKQCVYPNMLIVLSHDDTKDLAITTHALDLEYSKPDRSVVKTLLNDKFQVVRDVTY